MQIVKWESHLVMLQLNLVGLQTRLVMLQLRLVNWKLDLKLCERVSRVTNKNLLVSR